MEINYYTKKCDTACKCNDVESIVAKVKEKLNLDESIIKIITDEKQAQNDGISEIPSITINKKLVLSGYIPSAKELIKLIQKNR